MIWITSHDDGNIESYAALTRQNRIDYCIKHGYRYLLTQGKNRKEPELSPAWCLVATVRQALGESQEGDFIMLTGADSCIVDMDFKIESLLDVTADLLATRDENGLNTQGLLFRNCEWTRELIERWWAMRGTLWEIRSDRQVCLWEEQGGLMYLLREPKVSSVRLQRGQMVYFGAGDTIDVSAMPDVAEHVQFISQESVNGYPPEIYGPQYKEPVFMVHLPGKKAEERTYFIKRALGLVPRVPLPQAHWIDEQGNIQPPQ